MRRWSGRIAGIFLLLGGAPLLAEQAAIPGVVAAGTPVETIGEGFEGTEGPVGMRDGSLLFAETRAGRIQRVTPEGRVRLFLAGTNGSNSLAMSPAGDVISVQTADPALGIIYPGDHARRLADGFGGSRFARPNDLVASRRGIIFFTDPGSNQQAPADRHPAVYRLSATGELSRPITDIGLPNGIQLSPDEKTLYVADSSGDWLFAYRVGRDGSLSGKRPFARLAAPASGGSGADGLAVDAAGRLYAASALGVQVFDRGGRPLGIIALPKTPQNLAFAGPGKQYLYVVGRGSVYRIRTIARGFAGRAK